MIKRLLIFVVLVLSGYTVSASHIIGGEISYKCQGNDIYEVTMKIYRDCFNGGPLLDDPAFITIFNASNIVVDTQHVNWITDTIIPPNSPSPCLLVPPNVCVEEGTYIFQVYLPPTPGGYVLAYQRCCRNASIVNIPNPGNTGATYTFELNDACFSLCNNSAYFKNYPPIVICANQPLVFDHSAIDIDGDDLVYEICLPNMGAEGTTSQPEIITPPINQLTYVSPYTYLNPLDGSPALNIDAATGLLTITPTVIGQFVVGVCVNEFRNGVFLGKHLRDFQFNVVDCQPTVVAALPSQINNCTGFSFIFQNNSIGGLFYHWDFGIPAIDTDTSNSFQPAFTYSDTGIYTVTLIVNPGTICADTATAEVYVYPNLFGSMVAPGGCPNTEINFLDLSTSTYGDINEWLWSFGDGDTSTLQNPSHTFTTPGDYTVQLIVHTANGCADTIIQTSSIYDTPPITIKPSDTTIIYGTSTLLSVSLEGGGGTFLWSPSAGLNDPNSSTPIATPAQTTTYYVTIISPNGCLTIDSVIVRIIFVPAVNIPSGFSPNSDGVNDFFHPLIKGVVENADFRIYNRWGELIYQSNDAYGPGWNGKFKGEPQEIGVYVYVFNCKAAVTGIPHNFKGNVTLLR